MRMHQAAVALLLLAVLLYAAVAVPLRRQESSAAGEYRRLSEQRRAQQSRLAVLERRESRRQALAAAATAWGRGDVMREARLAMVRTLDQASLKDVRLGVVPGSTPATLAAIRLRAQGDFGEVVRATGQLVRPGSGFVLASVHMTPGPGGVTLSLEALVPRPPR